MYIAILKVYKYKICTFITLTTSVTYDLYTMTLGSGVARGEQEGSSFLAFPSYATVHKRYMTMSLTRCGITVIDATYIY